LEAAALLALVASVGVVGATRWYRAQREEVRERNLLRSDAHIWGLAVEPGETNSELRARLDAARRAGSSADPIETAARAMRAQRERSAGKRAF
jgi:hypothetical protein